MTQNFITPEKKGAQSHERLSMLLLILFAFIIFVAQALQYYNSKKIDNKYSNLINSSSVSIKKINKLLVHSSNLQRNILNLLLSEKEAEKKMFSEKISSFITLQNTDLKALDSIYVNENNQVENQYIEHIKSTNVVYLKKIDTLFDFLKNNQIEAAKAYRINSLRPTFTAYQDLQKDLTQQFTIDLVKESERLSSYTSKSSISLLLMGFSPILFVIAVLLYFVFTFFRKKPY